MIQTSWNLKNIFDPKTSAETRKKYEKLTKDFVKKWKDNKKFLTDEKTLLKALTDYENWVEVFGGFGDEMFYYYLATKLDQNDTDLKARYNKAYEFILNLGNEMEFFTIELSKISEANQKKFLKSKLLENFHYFLEKVFKASRHTLSEPEEKIMNLKSKVSRSNWVDMMQGLISKQERATLDVKGKKAKKNFNEILDLISHKNKKVRDDAAKNLNEIFDKYIEVAEHEMNSVLEDKKVNDGLRKYESPDDSRHLMDEVDRESVYALVKEVSKKFDIAKKFYKLKAKTLRLKKLAYHERNLDVGEVEKKYSFKKAFSLVQGIFKKLDPEFEKIYTNSFEHALVDVFPKKGKYSGAFCATGMRKHPTYVLLNFTKSLRDISVIAHEFGHAIHFEMSKANQKPFYYDAPLSTAEIASTFFEDFTFDAISAELSEKEKFALEISRLNDIVSTVFRQIAFYNFELELHETFRKKGYLSSEEIGKIFTKHMKSYMGEAVEQSEGSQNWWIYVSHFRSMFYVYSYAFGLLISKALQKMVREDHKNIEKIKYFLSAGSSKSPKEIFKDIGIDITDAKIWRDGLDEIHRQLEKLEMMSEK